MRPLDFVKTPSGSIGLVTETNDEGKQASVRFVYKAAFEKNAWGDASELEVLTSLPYLLADATAHPFGRGSKDVEHFFGEGE